MDKEKIISILNDGNSLRESADKLNVTLAKLYYYINKYKIPLRSKSEAQKRFLEKNIHQRSGTKHSLKSKEEISKSTSNFWESNQGLAQKERLVKSRRKEWDNKSLEDKKTKLNQLNLANKPKNGELSKFGKLLADFLIKQNIEIEVCKEIILNHKSDIIIKNIICELIPPLYIYGEEAEDKILNHYSEISKELNKLGYKVLIIEQISTGLSQARCRKILEEINELEENLKIIQS